MTTVNHFPLCLEIKKNLKKIGLSDMIFLKKNDLHPAEACCIKEFGLVLLKQKHISDSKSTAITEKHFLNLIVTGNEFFETQRYKR